MNLQPSEAEAGFDVRVPPIADPEALERRIAEEWAPISRNMTYEVLADLSRLFLFFMHHIITFKINVKWIFSCVVCRPVVGLCSSLHCSSSRRSLCTIRMESQSLLP